MFPSSSGFLSGFKDYVQIVDYSDLNQVRDPDEDYEDVGSMRRGSRYIYVYISRLVTCVYHT